jgi:hypothetical protein
MMEPVVRCDAREDGWSCVVTVGDDADATTHTVTVDRETLDDLAPGATPETLVATSFAFLLEREDRNEILRSFELPVIGRYFGGFPDEIRRRLAR